MARFILDVANLLPHQIEQVMDEIFDTNIISKSTATINCIDKTNENQFHSIFTEKDNLITGEPIGTNELSQEQIENFKKICNV